jgi:hypothetical protein
MNGRHVRATVYTELAARCRSLAAVRYASLAAGEAPIKESEMKD